MTLSEFKMHLQTVTELTFLKPDSSLVPRHFHLTEIGQVSKKFMDCGGTLREEQVISMQLWESVDYWHRLEPSKLLRIIALAEEKLALSDAAIEVEYQADTIGKFGVDFEQGQFKLVTKNTTCLASDQCGISDTLQKVQKPLKTLQKAAAGCCGPNSGCC